MNLTVVKCGLLFGHPSAMGVESCELSQTKVEKLFEHSQMEVDELFKFSLRS